MATDDYYSTLGVPRSATADEIKAAFRVKARQYHPDVTQELDGEEKFKQVNEAYGVLSDEKKRRGYDLELDRVKVVQEGRGVKNEAKTGGLGDLFGDFGINSLFNNQGLEGIFGGGFGFGSSAKPVEPVKKEEKLNLRIPEAEMELMAAWHAALRSEGPIKVDAGSYKVAKDKEGRMTVEVNLSRFELTFGREDVLIVEDDLSDSRHYGLNDWINIGKLSPTFVDGVEVPYKYQDYIHQVGVMASTVVEGSAVSNKMISDLNVLAEDCFRKDKKETQEGQTLVNFLKMEGSTLAGRTKQEESKIKWGDEGGRKI